MLEPSDWKLSRSVLRGRWGGNTPDPPDSNMKINSKEELKGMTVNERLYVCGLFDEWDNAVKNRDKNEMINILTKVALSEEQAIETTNATLKNPKKYGF